MSNEKQGRGRPRSLSDKQKEKLIDFIKLGGSIQRGAPLIGSSEPTIAREQLADPDFRRRLAAATAECEQKHLRDIDATDPDWRKSLAFLGRKFPRDWSEHREKHVGKVAKPVPVEERLVTTRDDVARLRIDIANRNGGNPPTTPAAYNRRKRPENVPIS